jgi:hypothetical protein
VTTPSAPVTQALSTAPVSPTVSTPAATSLSIPTTATTQGGQQYFLKSIPKPDKFQKGQNFSRFVKRFLSYATLSKMKEDNLDLLFLSFIDHDETYEKLARIQLGDNEKRDISLLMEQYENAIYPTSSAQTLKSELQNVTQRSEESAEEFAFRISDISDKAYSNLAVRNESALATFIRGCNNSGIKAKILDAEVTNFDDAIRIAVKWEKINAVISPVQEHDSALYRIQERQGDSYHRQQGGQQHVPYRNMQGDRQRDVTNRDGNGSYNRFDRQRRPLQCWHCNEFGHRRAVCPMRRYSDQQPRDNNPNHVQQTATSNPNSQALNSNQAGSQVEVASRNTQQ